jgi:peroxiredoxin
MGDPDEAHAFCGARAPGLLCLADPEQEGYAAYGIGKAGAGEIFAPEVFVAGFQATLEGHANGRPAGDTRQMPATFVIGPDARVRLAYYSRTVADHPPRELIVAALRG